MYIGGIAISFVVGTFIGFCFSALLSSNEERHLYSWEIKDFLRTVANSTSALHITSRARSLLKKLYEEDV